MHRVDTDFWLAPLPSIELRSDFPLTHREVQFEATSKRHEIRADPRDLAVVGG